MQRIVVGVDGSEHARAALRWAIDEAKLRDATLVLVHAWHTSYVGATPLTAYALDTRLIEEEAGRLLDHAAAEASGGGLAPTLERRLVHGGAARAILDEAGHADLVVVGARGLGGFAGLLLGSVSQQVAHHAPCPVVIARGDPAAPNPAVG